MHRVAPGWQCWRASQRHEPSPAPNHCLQVFLHAQMALRLAGYRATKQPGAILEEVVDMARSVGIVDRQGESWPTAVQ